MRAYYVIFFLFIFSKATSQTLVSGTISANTTWAKSGSPYIITSTVLVQPGIQLTIEPGVTVRFKDFQSLETHDACLIASGTAQDSIHFVLDQAPTNNNFGYILLDSDTTVSKFDYCHVEIGEGIITRNLGYKLPVNNCLFTNNNTALYISYGVIVTNSKFVNHRYSAIDGVKSFYARISGCEFSNNDIGVNARGSSDILESNFTFNSQAIVAEHFTYVRKCNISNNIGGIVGYSGCKIDSCGIFSNSVGIANFDNGTITRNTISSNTIGIGSIGGDFIGGLIFKITDNIISGNDFGISVLKKTLVRGNTITMNRVGIELSTDCRIEKNVIINNNTGLLAYGDTILENEIRFNKVGVYIYMGFPFHENLIRGNTITANERGMLVGFKNGTVTCNKIADNTKYNLEFIGDPGPSANNFVGNDWGSSDSNIIASGILDGVDSPTAAVVKFLPIDVNCYVTIGFADTKAPLEFNVFPNPTTGLIRISLPSSQAIEYTLIDSKGQVITMGISDAALIHEINLKECKGIYLLVIHCTGAFFTKRVIVLD